MNLARAKGFLFLSLSLLLFLTTGCAAKFYVPDNRFLSPENSGALLHGEFKMGSASMTQVQIADDMTSANPDTTPVLSRNSSFYTGLDLGILSWVDLYGHAVEGSPSAAGIKLQILGAPNKTAKAGNISLAVAGAPVFGTSKLDIDNNGVKSTAELKFTGWEASVLAGYRFFDSLLIYAGGFQTHVEMKTDIQRTQNSVTTTTASPNGNGDVSGGNLGIRWSPRYGFFAVEGAYTTNTWTRTNPSEKKADNLDALTVGFVVGLDW